MKLRHVFTLANRSMKKLLLATASVALFGVLFGNASTFAQEANAPVSAKHEAGKTEKTKNVNRERGFYDTEILDSVELADKERKSLRPTINDGVIGRDFYNNGWLYRWISLYEGDIPPLLSKKNHLFCRINVSNHKMDKIFTSEYLKDLVAVDNNQLFFRDSNGLYKQRIHNDKRVLIKKIKGNKSNVENYISNVIVYNDRLYYAQPIDSIADEKRAENNICSMNTDGSDDKKITGRYYQDFIIYKGMIFARNNISTELEKLDINGNIIENYGKIGREYYDVYNDFIYYLDDKHMLRKIDISTKNKQLVNTNDFKKLNTVISRNHLFFNTSIARVGRNPGFGFAYGKLFSINLETGEMKEIYKERLCSLSGVYNGIIYGSEFIESDSSKGTGNVMEFQINIDGTGKKSINRRR